MPFNQIIREMNLQPQMKTILQHLVSRGSISPMEALNTYGIYRLSSAIQRLRKVGYQIETQMRRDEMGHTYARYSLAIENRVAA